MKNVLFLIALAASTVTFAGEKTTFTSTDKKVTVTTGVKGWKAAGNMKGIQIYLYKNFTKLSDKATVAISKEENLLATTTIEEYVAGKIFLQTAVLNANMGAPSDKTINGKQFKVFEYTYLDSSNEEMKSTVYFVKTGTTVYQMVFTSKSVLYEMNRAMYNELANSFTLK